MFPFRKPVWLPVWPSNVLNCFRNIGLSALHTVGRVLVISRLRRWSSTGAVNSIRGDNHKFCDCTIFLYRTIATRRTTISCTWRLNCAIAKGENLRRLRRTKRQEPGAELPTISPIYVRFIRVPFFFWVKLSSFFQFIIFLSTDRFLSVPSRRPIRFCSIRLRFSRTLSITVLGWGRRDKKWFFFF